MMLCSDCGHFVTALPDGDRLVPASDSCPECDGTAFEDVRAGRTVDTAEE